MKFLFFLLVLFLALSLAFSAPAKIEMSGFDLVQGKEVSKSFDEREFLVVYFLSSRCPCSQSHFDHLNSLQKAYPQFNFIGFHSDKKVNQKRAGQYFSKFNIKFPVLEDKELVYANHFKAVKTPHVFVYNREGEMLYRGGATDSRNPKRAKKFYLKEALVALSEGRAIEIEKTKTIGCYIQR